jgi:hypothetical protein
MKKITKFTGCLLVICAFTLILFVAGLSFAAWFTASVLDKKPVLKTEIPQPAPGAAGTASLKMQEVLNSIMNCSKGDSKKLTLTQDEVNSLISLTAKARQFGCFMSNKTGEKFGKDYMVTFKNGNFIVDYSKKLDIDTPFGSYLNTKIVFTPEFKGKERKINIKSSQIGSLEMSSKSLINTKIEEMISGINNSGKYEQYLESVTELKVDENNNLVIHYIPEKLKKIIQQEIFSGTSGKI